MTVQTTVGSASAGSASPTAIARKQGFRFRPRHLWIIAGLAVAILGSRTDSSLTAIGVMVTFGLLPHLSFLAGIGQHRAAGQMAPRALAVFNAMHHPAIPAAVVALNVTGVVPTLVFVAATAWLSHIVIGWGIGDGPRSAAPTVPAVPARA